MSLVRWKDYIDEATANCGFQFSNILEEYEFNDLNAEDIFMKICNRYVNFLRPIYEKNPLQFTVLTSLKYISIKFSKKEIKWLRSILKNRVENYEEKLKDEILEDLLLWVSLRYNFWLRQQIY